MRVHFTKRSGGRLCSWRAERAKRRVTTGSMGVGHRQLPHDLIQFVVESRLGIVDGFWGSIAAGATFKSTDRKRTQPGRAVVTKNRDGLDRAEAVANQHYQTWRDGGATPLRDALDHMLEAWLALPDEGTITLDWPAVDAGISAQRSVGNRG